MDGKIVGCLARVAETGTLGHPNHIETIANQLKVGAMATSDGMTAILTAHDKTHRPAQDGLFRSATPLPPAS